MLTVIVVPSTKKEGTVLHKDNTMATDVFQAPTFIEIAEQWC
jgi:hypothetical protein